MEALLNLIIKSGIGLLTLYLFYFALLRSETNFRFNRLYLLLAPVVALSLPLVKWPALLSPDTAIAQTLQAIQLTEVTVVAYRQSAAGSALLQFLTPATLVWSLYLLVALLLVFKLCRQLWHIRSLKSQATSIARTQDDIQILQLEQHYASFAFLHYVFLSNQEQLSVREKQQVLAHVQLGHTYDILFYELLSIMLWFNPVVWFLKQELRNLHEFQADARVLEQHQLKEYRTLLSKEVLFNMGLPVGSHFQRPQVLQRLRMLQQHGKQPGWLKPLLTLPLLVVLIFSLTSQQVAADIVTQLATATQKNQPGKGKPQQSPLQTLAPAADNTLKATPAPMQTGKMPITKGDTTADMPVRRSENPAEMPNGYKEKAYTYVEQMPQFKGGEAEMLKYLGMHIRYPEEAQEAKAEGIVVASFTVEENGTLSDIQIIKKLGLGLDEEVIRVVKSMNGRWLPGKQSGKPVRVQYTLPVRFTIK